MRTFCLVVAVIAASAFDPASTGRVRLNPLRQSRNDAKTSFLHMQAPPTTLYDDYMKSRGMATRDASPMVDSPAVAAPETPAQPPAGKAAPTFNFLEFANTPKSDTDIDYERVPWWKQDSSFSETQRADRRTIFMHDDWVRHRSSERFLRNMMSIGSSGINQALRKELSFVTLTAVFVVVFNMLFVSYQDFSGISHLGPLHDFDATIKALSLPALPFSIAMPALSLLLVFRTNTAYFRWNEARTLWGGLINNCRNVVRQSNTFFPDDPYHNMLKQRMAAETQAFDRATHSPPTTRTITCSSSAWRPRPRLSSGRCATSSAGRRTTRRCAASCTSSWMRASCHPPRPTRRWRRATGQCSA